MDTVVTSAAAAEQTADVWVIGIPADAKKLPRALKAADDLVGGHISRDLEDGQLKGKVAVAAWYRAPAGADITHVLAVGLGDGDETALRRAAFKGIQAATAKKAKRVVFQVFSGGRRTGAAVAAGAIAEGGTLATFNAKNWAAEDKDVPGPPAELVIADVPARDAAKARRAVKRGRILGAAANTTRFLVNEPANNMTPSDMAKKARAIGREFGLDVRVLSRAQCEKLGMRSYLSVSQGSAQPPQFLVLRYTGRRARTTLALVGKGVTFDTGGISLKPSAGMEEMKFDMGGAATVLGAMQAIAQLKPAVNVVGICPCTENMPSGTATKPGDIFTAMNGKTIEVINTDAEGRLILADALCYAVEKAEATYIVDLATLTGACIIALGHEYTAALGNDDDWTGQVLDAADAAGEKVWQLPMDAEYGEGLKSKIADVANITSSRGAGTITAGKFLENFVGKTPWVHLDIAGSVWVNSPHAGMPKGPTGAVLRTLVTLAESL